MINRHETAALVVDYQTKLMPVMRQKEQLLKNSCILLKGLKTLGVPMYLTQQYTKGLGAMEDAIYEAAGTSAYAEKISFSAYEAVKEQISGKKQIIVCGIEAHICVLQTVLDLLDAGYQVFLVCDCISTRKELDMTYALERAKVAGAILTTYESVLFELMGKAGTDEAKVIQKLIR